MNQTENTVPNVRNLHVKEENNITHRYQCLSLKKVFRNGILDSIFIAQAKRKIQKIVSNWGFFLPYILKSSVDCTFFFFHPHINLKHLLFLNFGHISKRLKKVCLWRSAFSAFVCLRAFKNGLFKKPSKNFQMFWSGFLKISIFFDTRPN